MKEIYKITATEFDHFQAVFRSRIHRIHMFLGLLDPGSTSQRYGSGSFYYHAKIVRKTLIPSVL
jgi:hypothetical protein